MSQNKDKSRVSPAMYLSLLGLAGIGVFSFFGCLLTSDGSYGWPIICAIIITGVLAACLWLIIYAKTTDNNPDKWKFVEWGGVGLYVILAFICAFPFLNYFYVISEKKELQEMANVEFAAIENLRESYNRQCEDYITVADQQLINYRDQKAAGVGNYKADQTLDIISGISNWRENAADITKLSDDPSLGYLKERIDSWDVLEIPVIAEELKYRLSSTPEMINTKISGYAEKTLIPEISGGVDGEPIELTGLVRFDFETMPEPELSNTLAVQGQNGLGWFIYVFLNCLVLLSWLVAKRADYVGPRRSSGAIGGRAL